MSLQFRLVFLPIIAFLATYILGACRPQQVSSVSTNVPNQITPYWTATPSPTQTPRRPEGSPTGTSIPATIPPPPTPTPFTYVIEKGDTMGVIAYRFGVTVADLRAANPDVDPNLMSIGTVLVIPILDRNDSGTPEVLATPTPIPIDLDRPVCYPAASGGEWCIALAFNELGRPVESLIAWIQLASPDGEVIASQQAIPLLNLLPAGQYLPVMAYFQDVTATDARPQIELISALPVSDGDRRYLPVDLQVEETAINPDGLQATVRGYLTLLALPTPIPTVENPDQNPVENTQTPIVESTSTNSGQLSQVWLAVTAYDANDLPVGVRKWETAVGLSPGDTLPFEVSVYSLGPKIMRVEVLAEANP